MKKLLQRIIVCLLALVMLFSAVACNEKTEKKKNKKPKKETTSSVDDTDYEDEDEDDDEDEDEEDEDEDDDDDKDVTSKTSPSTPTYKPSNTTSGRRESKDKTEKKDDKKEEEEIDPTAIDETSKPHTDNPAALPIKTTSAFDNEALALRKEINDVPDTGLPKDFKGRVWYVSNKGDNKNDGHTPQTALADFNGIRYYVNYIQPGDAILFERGGVYRGSLTLQNDMYVGAYGVGEKPCIYGSKMNYARVSWKNKHGNVWYCEAPFSEDTGNIVFNHGEMVGYKRTYRYDLENNGDFWCDPHGGYRVYVYMDQNPAEKFWSIEIGTRTNIITVPNGVENVLVENLCLKYSGGHGVGTTNPKGVTVRGCEIGFIGGSYLSNTTRFGNGVEFYGSGKNCKVEKCWIYQIYDSGVTHQGGETFENIVYDKNLIEYCGMGSVEYWLTLWYLDGLSKEVYITNNIMRFAGMCWGGIQRPDKCSTHILADVTCQNAYESYIITGNIFDQSSGDLIHMGGSAGDLSVPTVISGNTYAQSGDGLFGAWKKATNVDFDADWIKSNIESDAVVHVY